MVESGTSFSNCVPTVLGWQFDSGKIVINRLIIPIINNDYAESLHNFNISGMTGQKKQIIFVLNSNELDGPSRVIYELSLALKNQFRVTVYVPIIPRYKLFVLQSCKNLGWLASLAKQIHYCFRWLTIDLVVRKLK